MRAALQPQFRWIPQGNVDPAQLVPAGHAGLPPSPDLSLTRSYITARTKATTAAGPAAFSPSWRLRQSAATEKAADAGIWRHRSCLWPDTGRRDAITGLPIVASQSIFVMGRGDGVATWVFQLLAGLSPLSSCTPGPFGVRHIQTPCDEV